MAQCKKCSAIIPDNREYCNKCMKEIDNPGSEDYLDNLLNQNSNFEDIFSDRPSEPDKSAVTDEHLDSMLAANLTLMDDEEKEEVDLDNAFDFLISDSDEKIVKKDESALIQSSEDKEVDDIDILGQIIDNFAYEEEEDNENNDEYNYDSLIDEVLAGNTPSASDNSEEDEISSLLDTDFFDNLASKVETIEDKEYEPYDENTIASSSDDKSLEEALFSEEPMTSENFVSSEDIESLLNSLGAELGEDVSYAMDSSTDSENNSNSEYIEEDDEVVYTFWDKFKSLFANKGEQIAHKKQGEIDLEEEVLKNQLKVEKEERKKLKEELKKAKDAEKAEKKAKKEKELSEKKRAKANKVVEVVVDEGHINKIGATIVVLFGAALCALIILGINWFSYSNTISRAKKYYEQGQYNEAYTQIAAMELKEDDVHLYKELRVLSKVYSEFEYYESAMKVGKKDDAIMHLVKGVRKYNANIMNAKEYEIEEEFEEIYKKIIAAFDNTFSIKEKKALEMAEMSDNDVVKVIETYKNIK